MEPEVMTLLWDVLMRGQRGVRTAEEEARLDGLRFRFPDKSMTLLEAVREWDAERIEFMLESIDWASIHSKDNPYHWLKRPQGGTDGTR